LIVAPMERSAFSFRIVDYKVGLDPKQRVLIGLIHLGIAAVAYPRESDLESDIVVRRSAEQVERFLREACEALAEQDERDPEARDDAQDEVAWRAYLAIPPARRTRQGKFTADCAMGMITKAFEWLIAQGMARDASGGVYQLLDRYRVQVREVAGHQALKCLRSIAQDADFDVTIDAESDSDADLVVDADAEGADVLVGERGPV